MSHDTVIPIATRAKAAHVAAEAALQRLAPAEDQAPVRLHNAMRHSLLSPGKRVRPILAILSAEQFGAAKEHVVASAAAIEMVHAASLILDDLPAMDDASIRRGRPTNHEMFGDDTAMLASIGLMNLAYEVVGRDASLSPAQIVHVVIALSRSIGSNGLVAGQEEDLHGLPASTDPQVALATMHRRKTGALFAVAAEVGGIVSDQNEGTREALYEFGMRLGHAFQTLDDVLDAIGSSENAGKATGVDGDKPTLVSLIGTAEAIDVARQQVDDAIAIVPGGPHCELARYARHLSESLLTRLPGTS